MHKRGKSAYEVHSYIVGGALERLCDIYISFGCGSSADKRYGRYGNPFIDDRNTVSAFKLLADPDKVMCRGGYLVVYSFAKRLLVVAYAVKQ